MIAIARFLIILGLVLILIGGVTYFFARFDVPIGRLPGDIRIQTRNITCFFPLVTSILLSILLTIILNVIARYLIK